MRIRWLCLTGVAVTVLAVPMSRSQPAIPAERAVPAAPAKVQEGGDRGDFPALVVFTMPNAQGNCNLGEGSARDDPATLQGRASAIGAGDS